MVADVEKLMEVGDGDITEKSMHKLSEGCDFDRVVFRLLFFH